MTEPGRRWAAVKGVLHFADFLQRDDSGWEAARYLTTGNHSTPKLMAHALGRANVDSPVFPV